jgi:hypothetical protein
MNTVIVGGGSSVREGLRMGLWDRLSDTRIFAVNYAGLRMPYAPDMACWLDHNYPPEAAKALGALPCPKYTKHLAVYGDAEVMSTTNQPKDFPACLEDNIQFVGRRTISGIFALSLAIWLKCPRIFLLGFDWNVGPDGVSDWCYETSTKRAWLKNDVAPYDDISDHDVFKGRAEIFNVSPITHIKSFPVLTYEKFFEMI